MKKNLLTCFLLLAIFLCGGLTGCLEQDENENETNGDFRTIVDMAGREVNVPRNITRVIDISDGFTTSVLHNLGITEKIIALGSRNLEYIDRYDFITNEGDNYSYENGMNPVTYLNPWLMNLTAVGQYGVAINYETIASLAPDVVIVRVGYCSLNTDEYGDEQDIERAIDTLQALNIPLVILYGPPAYSAPTIENISREISIIGQVFGMQSEAEELADYLESIVHLIQERIQNYTQNFTDDDKPRVLIFGLSPNARDTGGAGDVLCEDTMESFFVEGIVNAQNAYEGTGGWKILSTEQILALNPDVIVLPTDWGYHPPRELYTAPYYQNLQGLDAIQNKRVWALPYTPYNCAKRVEYPIELMIIAKAAYPEVFADFKIHEWVLEFYMSVYHVDYVTAQELRAIQWLEWTVEEDV